MVELNALVAILLALGPWTSGDITVEADLSPENPTLADEIELELSIRIPLLSEEEVIATGSRTAWKIEPFVQQLMRAEGLVLTGFETENATEDGHLIQRWKISLTPGSAGELAIPALAIEAESATGGESITVRTDEIPVVVSSVLTVSPEEAEPQPNAGTLQSERGFPWPAILLAILVWAGLRWMMWRRKKAREELMAAIPRPTTLQAPASAPADVMGELRANIQTTLKRDPDELAREDSTLGEIFNELEPLVFGQKNESTSRIPPELYDRICEYVKGLPPQ